MQSTLFDEGHNTAPNEHAGRLRAQPADEMSVIPGTSHAPGAADLYLLRARAEVGELDRKGVAMSGTAFPQVLFLKGCPGPAELAGGGVLSGPDGVALTAALDKLGYPAGCWAAAMTVTTAPGGSIAEIDPEDVALIVETFDPELVVALDEEARLALERAWGSVGSSPLVCDASPRIEEGRVGRVRGRRVLALGGFESALGSDDAKQIMWARLKLVPPLGAPL